MAQHGGAKKMRLMMDSEYERFVNGNLPKPHPFVSGSTSGGAVPLIARPESEILKDKSLGDDQKWKIISEQLHRMLQTTSEQRKKPLRVQIQTEEDAGKDGSGSNSASVRATVGVRNSGKVARLPNFLVNFPKNLQTKAVNVIRVLKDSGDIEWDGRGKVFIDGNDVEGSHIADLVKFSLRTSRSAGKPPTGWDEFCAYLADIDIPPSLISNTQLKQILISQPSKDDWATPPSGNTVKRKNRSPDSTTPTPKKPASARKTRPKTIQFEEVTQHGSGRR